MKNYSYTPSNRWRGIRGLFTTHLDAFCLLILCIAFFWSTMTAVAVPGFDVQVINTSGSNPGNNTANWLSLWNAVDALPPGSTGTIDGRNVVNNTSDVEVDFNYQGGGCKGSNRAIDTISGDGPGGGGGPWNGGNDYSIRAGTFLDFSVGGTYTIALGSDDGRRIELTEATLGSAPGYTGFTSLLGQFNGTFNPGDTVIGFSGSTGHQETYGVFMVAAGDRLRLDAFYYNGGGGHSGELLIYQGNPGGDTCNGSELLTDGVFGITVNQEPDTDGDGFLDSADNCPTIPNPDQDPAACDCSPDTFAPVILFPNPLVVDCNDPITPGLAPTLTVTSGLELWFDGADIDGQFDGSTGDPAIGAPVTSWVDKSGNGRLANDVIGDPSVVAGPNGNTVLAFDGDDALRTDAFSNPRTFLAGDDAYTLITVARYSGTDRQRVISAETGHNWLFGFHGDRVNRWYYDGWLSQDVGGGIANDTSWQLHAGEVHDLTSGNPLGSTWRNGVPLTVNGNGSGNSFDNNVPDGLSFGAWNGLGESSQSEVAEVIMFNRVLTPAEMEEVGSYLESKYALNTAHAGLPNLEATAIDFCDPDVTAAFVSDSAPVGDSCSSTILRTWTSTDAAGNTSLSTQTIIIVDTTPPVFDNPPANVAVPLNAACMGVPPVAPVVTATDDCQPLASVTVMGPVESDTGTGCNRFISRVWSADDGCGNVSSYTQIITFADTTPPTITFVPPDVTVECGTDLDPANTGGSATGTDACQALIDQASEGGFQTLGYYGRPRNNSDINLPSLLDAVVPDFSGVSKVPMDFNNDDDFRAKLDNPGQPDDDYLYTYNGILTVSGAQAGLWNFRLDGTDDRSAIFIDLDGDGDFDDGAALDPAANADTGNERVQFENGNSNVDLLPGQYRFMVLHQEHGGGSNFEYRFTPPGGGQVLGNAADLNQPYFHDVQYCDVILSSGNTCVEADTVERTWIISDGCGNQATAVQIITLEDNMDPMFDAGSFPADISVDCGDTTFSPRRVAGLEVWYDASTITGLADGDTVTAWADQSGNGRDLVPWTGTPTFETAELNGLPAVRFDQNNENLQMADPSNEYFAKETYLVFRAGDNRTTFGPDWGAPFGVKDGNDADRMWMMRPNEDRFWNQETPAAVSRNGVAINAANQFDMSAQTGNASMGEYMVLRIVANEGGAQPSGNGNGSHPREYIVGTRTDAWANSRWDTAEILAFNRQLSPEEETLIGEYLANKYALPTTYDSTGIDLATVLASHLDPAFTGLPTGSDSCDPNPVITYMDDAIPGAQPNEWIVTRTFIITDSCDHSVTSPVTQTINVLDNTAPVIMDIPDDISIACEEDLTPVAVARPESVPGMLAWYDAGEGITTDANGVLTWVDKTGNGHDATRASGSPALVTGVINGYPVVETRGGNDYFNVAGIMDVKQQIVVGRRGDGQTRWNNYGAYLGRRNGRGSNNLFENNNTTFHSNQHPQSVSKDGVVLGSPFNLDPINEFAVISITVNDNDRVDELYYLGRSDHSATDLDIAEVLAFDHQLTPDEEQEIGSYLASKYGIDTTYPTVALTGVGAPTVMDSCDPQPTILYEDDTNGCVITRTFQAMDACGNLSPVFPGSQTITLIDNDAPTLICPAGLTIFCGDSTDPAVNPSLTAALAIDNCDPAPMISYVDASVGGCPDTISRVWTATDTCGNSTQCVQTIQVIESINLGCINSTNAIPPPDTTQFAAILAAGGPVMDLDFQGGPNAGLGGNPVLTQPGFTAFETHRITTVPDPSPSMNPSITVGPATFAITGNVGGYGTGSGTDALDRDFMFLGSALGYSESITWTLSGLTPNTDHTLTWYACQEGVNNRSSLISSGATSGSLVTDGPDLVMTLTSDAAGVITGTAARNGGSGEANIGGLSVFAETCSIQTYTQSIMTAGIMLPPCETGFEQVYVISAPCDQIITQVVRYVLNTAPPEITNAAPYTVYGCDWESDADAMMRILDDPDMHNDPTYGGAYPGFGATDPDGDDSIVSTNHVVTYFHTNECLVTVERWWRVTDCCSNRHEYLESFQYPLSPQAIANAELRELNLGCISHTNQIPPPDFIAAGTMAECGSLSISLMGTQNIMTSGITLDDCESGFERVYMVTGSCSSAIITQVVTYVLNTAAPVITNFAFVMTGPPILAPSLSVGSTVLVSENNANFNISVFDGKAGYDNTGTTQSNPPLIMNMFGDGTVEDYNFVISANGVTDPISYADGGAGLTPDPVDPNPGSGGYSNNGGQNWANVWTTTDPGVNFSTTKNFTGGGINTTHAGHGEIQGTVDISGFQSGTLYFPHGTYINQWDIDVVMSGPGQPDIAVNIGPSSNGPGTNFGWISDFTFTNDGTYTTITYTYTNQDLDGSRARFMGVIFDGEALVPVGETNTTLNVIDYGCVDDPFPVPDTNSVLAMDADGDDTILITELAWERRETNACSVRVTRHWRVEDCCGAWHEADQVYIYGLQPQVIANAQLSNLDLGCITSSNQIPPPDFIEAGTMASCGNLTITQVSEMATSGSRGSCWTTLERVYDVATACTNILVTQNIDYVLNTEPPVLTNVAPYVDFGCDWMSDPAAVARITAQPSTGGTILSSEDGEGEPAVTFLQTTANGPSANIEYQLPGTFQHNNTWIQGHTASVNGPGQGSDPTGQHLLTRSTTGNMVLRNPLPLASGGYSALQIDFAVNVRYVDPDEAIFLDYSALGDFSDSVTVPMYISSTANGSGVPYEEDKWYAGQSVTLNPGMFVFTDTANIRWRSGGWANSTRILLDDIIITGIGATGDLDPTYGGFFPGWEATDADNNIISTTMVGNVYVTNDCQVTVYRTWRVEDCCGQADEALEIFSYNLPPEMIVNSMLDDLDLGCIGSTNQIPPPDFIGAGTVASCGSLTITQVSETALAPIGTCTSAIRRVYNITTPCTNVLITQDVTYVLNTSPPVITEIAPYTDYGCDGDLRPLPMAGGPGVVFSEAFEDPVVIGYVQGSGPPAGWVASNNGFGSNRKGMINENSGDFTTPNGVQGYLLDYTNAGLTTDVGQIGPLVANVTYTLSCTVAATSGTANYIMELVAFDPGDDRAHANAAGGRPGTVLNSVSGTVSTSDMSQNLSFNFMATVSDPSLGKDLGIRIRQANATGNTVYDNIQLISSAASPAADPDPTYGGLYRFIVEDADGLDTLVSTTMVQNVYVTNDCQVTVFRTWRVSDCCGRYDEAQEIYSFDLLPQMIDRAELRDLDMGCISSTNQIPPPDFIQAGTMASCGSLTITQVSAQVLAAAGMPGAGNSIGVSFRGSADAADDLLPGDVAGVVPQANWNNAVGTSGTAQPLSDATGAASGATVTWNTRWLASVSGDSPGDANAKLMKGYLDQGNNNTTTVSVNGIPYAEYDVIIYFDGGGNAGNPSLERSGDYSVNTVTQMDLRDNVNWPIAAGGGVFVQATSGMVGNFALFEGMSGSSMIMAQPTSVPGGDTTLRSPVNGIQIIERVLVAATPDCETTLERVYDVRTACTNLLVTQNISYVLNTEPPVLTNVAPYVDYGCEGDMRAIDPNATPSASTSFEVAPDHIVSGTTVGTLLAVDVPYIAGASDGTATFGGPDWPEDADDGFIAPMAAGDGIRGPMNGTSPWEPDGTPVSEAEGYFTFGNGPAPSVMWTFDVPDGAVVNGVYATWLTRNVDGITYEHSEAPAGSIVRQQSGAAPAGDLVLSWTDDVATTHNGNFEQIFSGPITVTGGDGFVLWGTDNVGNAAHIDAVVLDVTLPAAMGSSVDPTYGGMYPFLPEDADNNIVSTTLVGNVYVTNDCQVTVYRTWRVADCCGWADEALEIYSFDLTPQMIENAILRDLNMGCIGSTDQIPGPDFYEAGITASCGSVHIQLDSQVDTSPVGTQQELVFPVSATATSELLGGFSRLVANIVDGLEMDTTDPDGTPGNPTDGGSWLNNGTFAAPNDLAPEVVFDLGAVEHIGDMVVWNYNEAASGLFTRGVDELEILVSDDNFVGDTRSLGMFNFAIGTGALGLPGQVFNLGGVQARYVKFDIASNHGGDNNFVGLNEVQFYRILPDPCLRGIQRVYDVSTACTNLLVTQNISFVLNTEPPEITAVAPYIDYGCDGDLRYIGPPGAVGASTIIFSEDFESANISDGQFDSGFWGQFTDRSGGLNQLNPAATGDTAAWLNPVPPALGDVFATIHSLGSAAITLGDTYVAGTTYTLQFTHFRRDDIPGDDITARILTGTGTELAAMTFSAVASTDTYETRTISYTVAAGSPEIGETIRIQFLDPTNNSNPPQAGIDNISLTASTAGSVQDPTYGNMYPFVVGDADDNIVSTTVVGNVYVTNDCQVTVYRTWRVEDCCGQADEALEIYSFDLLPQNIDRAELRDLQMGCIGSTNQIPPPNFIAAGTSATCGRLSITQLRSSVVDASASGLSSELGVLNLAANGGINPATGNPWAAGDTYRLVFVTSGTRDGTSTDINDYNDFVQAAAASSATFGSLGNATWKVIGSTETVNARDNTGTTGTGGEAIFLTDGSTVIGNNYGDFWDGHDVGTQDIDLDENGSVRPQSSVFAGITGNGSTVNTRWLGASVVNKGNGTIVVETGQVNPNNPNRWARQFNQLVTSSQPFYALSDPLTIQAGMTDDCATTLERVYEISTACSNVVVTQYITYVLNTRPPVITNVASAVDYGCQGDVRTVAISSNAVMATDADDNIVSTQLVDEVRVTNDCQVTVYRTWRVEDCCGLADEALEIYSFSLLPQMIANATLRDLDLGCIASTNMIPPPDFYEAGTSSECDYNIHLVGQQFTAASVSAPVAVPIPNAGFEDREGFDPFLESIDRYNRWGQESWRHFEVDNNGGPLRIWNPGVPGVDETPQGIADVGFGGNAPEGKYVVVVRSRYNDNELHNPPRVRDFEAAVQILSTSFDPSKSYTLTAKVGRLPNTPAAGGSVNYPGQPDAWLGGYALQLAVGGTNVSGATFAGRVDGGTVIAQDWNGMAVPENQFVTASVTYTPDPAHAALAGLPLQIRLCALEGPDHATTSWAAFDDVSLVEASVGAYPDGCQTNLQRVYEIATECTNTLVTQNISFVLNDTFPEILTYAPGTNWFCQDEGFLPPTNWAAFSATNFVGEVSVNNVSVTNGCEVTVIRTFRIEDCCGNFDRQEAYHTYIVTPEEPEDLRFFVYAGCINDLDAVPGLEEATLERTNGCEYLELNWVSNSPPRDVPFPDFVLPVDWFEAIDPGLYNQQTNGCLTWYDRVYSLTDLCGQRAAVTQTVAYTLDQYPPRIVSVSNHVDYGCSVEDPRPVATSLTAIVVEHAEGPYWVSGRDGLAAAAPEPVTESRFTNDCFIQVFRTWRVVDCCGSYDEALETYSYIQQIDDLTVEPLAPLHLECINNREAIPLPEPDLVQVSAMCPLQSVEWAGDSMETNLGGCTSMFIRSYQAVDNCGATATVTQVVTYIVDQLPPVIESWPADTNLGCQALMPDPVPVANLTNDLVVSDDSLVTWRTNDDSRVTNGCEVTVTRRWVIRDCCGRLDERATEYTFTILPDAVSIDALADKYIGCITHTNQLPEPNVTLINASSACSVVTLDYLGEQNPTHNGCTSSVDRVYQATDLCGQTNTITQTVSWTLEPDQPEILAWELDADWNCQTNGWQVPVDTNALVATNVIGDATWTDVYSTNGCTVHLRRTWRVENCCWFTTVESDHTFTIRPDAATVDALAPLHVGCIRDLDQIPQPNETILSVSSACNVADITWVSNSTAKALGECTSGYQRVYRVEDICGQSSTVTQEITWVLEPGHPEILRVEGSADWSCRTNGWAPPVDTNAFAATGYIGQVSISEVSTTNGCLVILQRTFEVANCCGDTDHESVLHTWTLRPPAPEVLGATLVDLGCIADAREVPDVDMTTVGVTSDCPNVSIVYLTNTPAVLITNCMYELTRTFRATDVCGQQRDLVRTIRYRIDTQEPVALHVPGGYLGCTPAGTTPTNLPTYAEDEAAMEIDEDCEYNVTLRSERLYTNDPCRVELVRTYRIADACGNTPLFERVTWSWTVMDDGPVITGPTRRALGCINSTASIPDASTAPLSVSGQCVIVEFDHWEDTDHALSSNRCTWSFDRIYFARDNCDQVTFFTQQVFYILLSRPEILETEESADLGCVFGEPDLPTAIVSVVYVGNVPNGPTVTSNIVTNGCERTLTRTYRIEDCCGSFDEASVTFSWIAGPDPATIDGPMIVDLDCIDSPALIPIPNPAAFTVDANCGATISHAGDGPHTTSGCTISFQRTFHAVDICNRTNAFDQTITYSLRGPQPRITSVPEGNDFGCLSEAPDIPADSNAVEYIGSNIQLSYQDSLSTNGCQVTLTRTWSIDNCCGDFDEAAVVYTWIQPSPPVLTPPVGFIFEDDLGCNPDFSNLPLIDVTRFEVESSCGATARVYHASDERVFSGCTGTLIRTYTASDTCGNYTSVVQTFTFTVDTQAPTNIAVNAGGDLPCGMAVPAPDVGLVSVGEENCPGEVEVSVDSVSTARTVCAEVITHTYRVADACGNDRLVSVHWNRPVDDEAPVLTCPDPVEVETGVDCYAPVPEIVPDWTDNCGEVTVSQVPKIGTTLPGPSTQEVTVTVSDACGNSTSCVVQLIINSGCGEGGYLIPDVAIDKRVALGSGVDCATAVEKVSWTNGAAVTWCFRITNTGQVELQNVQLSDPLLGVSQQIAGSLAAGQNTGWIAIDGTIAGSHINTATVTGLPVNGRPPVSAADDAEVEEIAPPLELLKTVRLGTPGDGGQCPGVELVEGFVGDAVVYCFEIRNNGQTVIDNVRLRDDQLGIDLEVAAQLASGQSVFYSAASTIGGALTNTAWASGRVPTGPMTGTVANPDTAVVDLGAARIAGVVWEDARNDGFLDESLNLNLEVLGLVGVDVCLYEVVGQVEEGRGDGYGYGDVPGGRLIRTATTGSGGSYEFDGLPAGDYFVEVHKPTVALPSGAPPLPTTAERFETTLVRGDDKEGYNFGFREEPTAVRLTALEAVLGEGGVVVQWTAGSQSELLGYRVSRKGEVISPLIPSRGAVGTYGYTVVGATGGRYTLEAVGIDLEAEALGSALTQVDAAPQGEPSATVQAESNQAVFTSEAGVTTYFVYEFDTEPTVTDLTHERELKGQVIEVDGKYGVYFSPTAGAEIQVR